MADLFQAMQPHRDALAHQEHYSGILVNQIWLNSVLDDRTKMKCPH
jgi:hypothetical protein